MIRRFFTRIALLLLAGGLCPALLHGQETQRQFLSGHGKDDAVPWRFLCTTGALSGFWTNLPVPSNWEMHGFGQLNFQQDSTNAGTERGLYERDFTLPPTWFSQRVYLVFEGAMTDTSAKLNGESVGPTHQGGFSRFKYDVTPFLKYGATNKLEVEVAKHSATDSVNKAERLADSWLFGGIYRPVYLEAVPSQFIRRVAIDARHDGTISLEVFTGGVKNADAVEAQVTSLDGKPDGEVFVQSLTGSNVTLRTQISNPRTWTAETPNLYFVEARLKQGSNILHRVKQRFGFRTMEVRDGEGLFINDRKVILKGVNRRSFWPDSGRCLSEAVHRLDLEAMKEMNMNAVRTAQFPPDREFLDLCDELGFYVLDELAGWQNHYDTDLGRKLVEELVTRDVNHPSILFWDNGSEGGFNPNLDYIFFNFDPQQRRTLHPGAPFNGVNTAHFLSYDKAGIAGTGTATYTRDGQEITETNNPVRYLYLPTAILQGRDDSGAGAGLEDCWRLMQSSPLGVGAFIAALRNENLKRPDPEPLAPAGNQSSGGILGPYRQREASFSAIKEIWSPITVAPNAQGTLIAENHYSFTDANQCQFTWQLRRFSPPSETNNSATVIGEGPAAVASIPPGTNGPLTFKLPTNWTNADALTIRVNDPTGRELWTWSWPMSAGKRVQQWLERGSPPQPISASETEHAVEIKTGDFAVTISKDTGLLFKAVRGGQTFSLGAGPRLAEGGVALLKLEHKADTNGYAVNSTFEGELKAVNWRVRSNGWVQCDYQYTASGTQAFFGVVFNYLEAQVKKKRWLGDGPHRVWKNRLRGGTPGVWENDYLNPSPDHSGGGAPEFKGCFANVRWLQLETTEGCITVVPERIPFVQVLTPAQPPDDLAAKTKVNLPQCGLGFLHGIPPISSKFQPADQGGPQGQPNFPAGEYSGSISFYFGKLP